MIYRYLDCGILKNGFARVRCGDCGHEYLLAFSCKRRHFCPSCHQKRVVAFIENPDVIKKILKHLGQWDVKRKPRPTANAPPIDVFPTYDEQPGPNTDDYIRDPDYPAEAYF